jgi:hypothetical protein
MSLSNVLLLHVSTVFFPGNDKELDKEQQKEFYALLDLPKYAPLVEIRKAYRRASLKLQCDRMMLEWNGTPADNDFNDAADLEKAKKALDEKEQQLQEAYRVLGDGHLRQQYHLLECRPWQYRIIRGPMQVHEKWTHTRRWFPFLVLQSVLV